MSNQFGRSVAYNGVECFIGAPERAEGGVFASGAGASGLVSDEISEDLADDMNSAADELDMPLEVTADEEMPMGDSADANGDGDSGTENEILTLFTGAFTPRSHPGSGTALVLNDGTEQRFLRFEDFSTDNGPDLDVYLSAAPPDADASEFDDDFISLGDLKGNIGSQNYEIPPDVDLERYSTVVVWCVRFGVAFTVADLSAAS